jgi:hypothetical protein
MELLEAKELVEISKDNGIDCPCCGQFVKRYKRVINAQMAAALVAVYKHEPNEFFHVGRFIITQGHLRTSGGGDFAKLRYWGLIEAQIGFREDGCKHNGHFRMTQKGRDFVQNKKRVESHVYLYDGQLEGFSDSFIDIETALGKKFNYSELMRGI